MIDYHWVLFDLKQVIVVSISSFFLSSGSIRRLLNQWFAFLNFTDKLLCMIDHFTIESLLDAGHFGRDHFVERVIPCINLTHASLL